MLQSTVFTAIGVLIILKKLHSSFEKAVKTVVELWIFSAFLILKIEFSDFVVMSVLILLLMVFFGTLPLGGSTGDDCPLELMELKESIHKLNYELILGDWKLMHLRTHRHIRPAAETKQDNTTLPALPSTGGNLMVNDRDCSELFDRLKPESGFYRIRPDATLEPFLVYCDMEDGGGWTVVQKRRNGKVNFDRDWGQYKNGFGHFKSSKDEFWLGNDHIHSLLYGGEKVMKIDLMDWNGEKSYAIYDNFRVANEKDKYRLYFGMYSGRAGDALSGGSSMVEQWSASHSGMQFTTRDQDNDRYLQGNCAIENKGGWWYNRCHAANLNGKFYRGGKYTAKHDNGVVWSTWRGLWYSLRHISMKVRPTAFMDSLGSGAGPDS
ncbi:fibrinogen like 1B [Pangasianodon hypophthalmus]|uniref:fibrinogen like 1B n=1 Tax=Pangasianodon hypophthalmus TaxID=310915 RepID=UPI000EFE7872|nr:fibrinogen like 1B [Pangasianodon hypophthalmus]XP_053097394.1 fibrinogen like 1B [Pangasianodon hypophthalmus]